MRSLHFSLLPFAPKRLPAPFLRRVPALARSPQLLDTCPEVTSGQSVQKSVSLRCFPCLLYTSDGYKWCLPYRVLWTVRSLFPGQTVVSIAYPCSVPVSYTHLFTKDLTARTGLPLTSDFLGNEYIKNRLRLFSSPSPQS